MALLDLQKMTMNPPDGGGCQQSSFSMIGCGGHYLNSSLSVLCCD
jgi:hypothetical protein